MILIHIVNNNINMVAFCTDQLHYPVNSHEKIIQRIQQFYLQSLLIAVELLQTVVWLSEMAEIILWKGENGKHD